MAYKTSVRKVTPYIICDFETGGLDMSKCGLTELAMIAVKGDTLEEIGRYETLIKPHQVLNSKNEWFDAEYTEGAQKVTGLSKEYLEINGKDIDEVANEVFDFMSKANIYNSKTGWKPVIVAHNAQYEVKCFQNLSKGRFDLSKHIHGDVDFYGNFQPHYIDTLDLAKLLYAANERMTNFKLQDVMDRMGIPLIDAHRAMQDVKPTTEGFQMIINLLRSADRAGILNQSNSEVGEDGKITRVNNRTFKFQFR